MPLGDVFYLGIYGTDEQQQQYVNWFYGIAATNAKRVTDSVGDFGWISFQTKKFILKLAYSWHGKAMELVDSAKFSRATRKRIAWIKALRMAIGFYKDLPNEKIVPYTAYVFDLRKVVSAEVFDMAEENEPFNQFRAGVENATNRRFINLNLSEKTFGFGKSDNFRGK